MGDLFATFNPQTVVYFSFAGNWVSALVVLLLVPQGFWLIKRQVSKGFEIILMALINELKSVFGGFINPGVILIFSAVFIVVISGNFFGLFPYVFTASRHLSITLALSLPLWLGRMIIRFVKQFNRNIAHLVPMGTPAALMPVIVLIESISSIIRPGTLAVRLAANMVAGHLLLVLLGGQGPTLGLITLRFLIVGLLALISLECGVACIQAYVFTILRRLYLNEHNRKVMNR